MPGHFYLWSNFMQILCCSCFVSEIYNLKNVYKELHISSLLTIKNETQSVHSALTFSVPNDVHVCRAFLVERPRDVHVREKMHHQRPHGFSIVPSQRPHRNLRYSHTDQTTYMYAIRYARQRPNDVPPLPALPDLYMFFYVLDLWSLNEE